MSNYVHLNDAETESGIISTIPKVKRQSFRCTAGKNTVTNLTAYPEVSDAFGGVYGVSTYDQPVFGSVTYSGGVFIYTPNVDFTGQDTITYIIVDTHGRTGLGEVIITVS